MESKFFYVIGQGGQTTIRVNASDLVKNIPRMINDGYIKDISNYKNWSYSKTGSNLHLSLYLYKPQLLTYLRNLGIRLITSGDDDTSFLYRDEQSELGIRPQDGQQELQEQTIYI